MVLSFGYEIVFIVRTAGAPRKGSKGWACALVDSPSLIRDQNTGAPEHTESAKRVNIEKSL